MISVDLGTTNLLVAVKDRGIVFNEPVVLAIERENGRIAAIGNEVELVAEKAPPSLMIVSPMRRGVIADYALAQSYLKHALRKCLRRPAVRRPPVAVGTLSSIKDIDRRALYQVLESAGCGAVSCCYESVAAAAGMGLPVWEPRGIALCDVGGGVSEVAVLCLGGVVEALVVPVGGADFNAAIQRHVRDAHKLNIGNRSAEALKIQFSSSGVRERDGALAVSGVNRLTGLPQRIQLNTGEILEALEPQFVQISDGIKKALRQVSPELMADIVEGGIVVCGGGALLGALRRLIEREIGIGAIAAEQPLTCVAVGLMGALDDGRPRRGPR